MITVEVSSMKELSWKVYKHTNLINGKSYIGITCKSLNERCGANGKQYRSNKSFYEDILMYGWVTGFNHEILYDNLTKQQAKELEHMLIEEYATLIPNGYNSQRGTRKVIYLPTRVIYYSICDACREKYSNEIKSIAYARIRNSCEKEDGEWRWV